MAEKTIYEDPRTTDTILFDLVCPGADGCQTAHPYKVDRVTIYYTERNFLGENWGEYDKTTYNDATETKLLEAQKTACDNPTAANLLEVQRLQDELDSTAQTTTYYFRDRRPVKVFGSPDNPAWLSTDTDDALLELVEEDDDGNPQYGVFRLTWRPEGGVREGDYFICWTWTPLPAGDSLTSHSPFYLMGNPHAVTAIPTHVTPDHKYEVLLERYLPEMYKVRIAEEDRTPIILDYLNKAVARGFTDLEDLVNQLIDLFDANALHESILAYLSNLFNIRLKSDDPTLWRRQIKEAVPVFKQKGTKAGLEAAFAQAGMRLDGVTHLWQLVSKYTWVESFTVEANDDLVWDLHQSTIIEPIDDTYFGLWVRESGSSTYTELSKELVTFEEEYGVLRMSWNGNQGSSPTTLEEGDIIKVKYQYKEVPDVSEANLETYFQTLPLADNRDEADQDYPPKNWNVRLLEEDDPLFDLLVPVKHPYQPWLVFGQVRTEFPYSENIYNMEEYNGSTRDSYDVCMIGKEFIDPCGACLSSKLNLDIAVEQLSNDRLAEVTDILQEYLPFHAVPHALYFSGEAQDFVQSPVEEIDILITWSKIEYVISGEQNPFFHRVMEDGLTNWIVDREDLATKTSVANGTGTAYNVNVKLISPDQSLQDIGLDYSNHIMEVLAPSPNAGTYTIGTPDNHVATVTSTVVEPLNQSAFTFRLSNVMYGKSSVNITQDDLFTFTDSSADFTDLSMRSQWDVEHDADYTGGPWKVEITGYGTYEIVDIQPNFNIILEDDGTLPVAGATGLTYKLLNDSDVEKADGTSGVVTVARRALVTLNDAALSEATVSEFIHVNDYLEYGGSEYRITGFDGINPYIDGYTAGDASGVSITTRRRILSDRVGYFNYTGLVLDMTPTDFESTLGILDYDRLLVGEERADDNNYQENYLVRIDSIDGQAVEYYYKMEGIDSTLITLAGLDQSFGTLTGTGGETVTYTLLHIEKDGVETQWMPFEQLDRRGKDPVVREILEGGNIAIVALSQSEGSSIQEHVAQEEEVDFQIEYRDGSTEEGEV